MFGMLLVIIYISFISLGLPDALLGSAWPVMYRELGVPISYAGIVSLIISGGTIVSSLNSDRVIKKMGTGRVTAVSVGMTAIGLVGFSLSSHFWMLCVFAVPYGLGAGSVDAALNNFVANHYKAKHMNWLHCFWGVGATIGPYIMGFYLTRGMSWNMGYMTVAIIQMVVTSILILSLPLWKKAKESESEEDEIITLKLKDIFKISGVKSVLIAFFCYCGLEQTTGLWGSSYMVMKRGIPPEKAATFISIFYLGITVGRFVSGFVTAKVDNKGMVRIGQAILFVGVALLFIPLGQIGLIVSFALIGLGCAPIYPSLIHETPNNFGRNVSQSMIGIQMASAYTGSTIMPPILGILSAKLGLNCYPIVLMLLTVVMIIMAEKLNKTKKINI